MILIYPPLTKPCEPPAGLAYLAGAVKGHPGKPEIIDLNWEGIMYLLEKPMGTDVPEAELKKLRTKLALKNQPYYLRMLRQPDIYRSPDTYKKAVYALNHLSALHGREKGFTVSLANYEHDELSPLRSQDLVAMAMQPERDLFYPYFTTRLRELIEIKQPHVIGFSLNFLHQALCTFAMLGFLRKSYPDLKLILGGGLVTSWLKNSRWQNAFQGLVDELVAGPGEAFLMAHYGIESAQQLFDPDYDDVCHRAYLAPGLILPVSGSRGCYWKKCAFCPEKAEDNPYQALAPRPFIESLQRLIRSYNPVLVHFLDNALSRSHLQALAANPLHCSWYGYARFLPELTDLDFCLALKASGCRMLKLGLESGDEDVLAHMQKGINLQDVPLILANLKTAGIATYIYILFGTPWETPAKAERTRDFLVKHSAGITFLNLALFNLPLDTPEAAALEGRDFYQGDLSLYAEFSHPEGWNRRDVRLFIKHECQQHQALAPILNRTPPFFTSNHAPFFDYR